MRPNSEYTALTVIKTNTGVRAYNPGDDVPASAVENLGLVVGTHVMPTSNKTLPRPEGRAKRADWEAYWLGQGMTQEEIDGLNRDELAEKDPLIEVSEEPPPPFIVAEQNNPAPDLVAQQANEQAAAEHLDAPGPHARKDEWMTYAMWRGMDEQTAKDSTIAQLEAVDYDTLFGAKE